MRALIVLIIATCSLWAQSRVALPAMLSRVNIATASAITSASDNFARANGDLGANWFTNLAANDVLPRITNNAFTPSTNNNHTYAAWGANSFGNNQFSQMVQGDITSFTNAGSFFGLISRANTNGTDQLYLTTVHSTGSGTVFASRFYYRSAANVSTNSHYRILKEVSTNIWASGDTVNTVVYDLSPIRMYMLRNGVPVMEHVEFSNLLTNGQPGLGCFGALTSQMLMSNWTGGTAVVPVSITDNFTRADAFMLGTNWISADLPGQNQGLRITSNKAREQAPDGVKQGTSWWGEPMSANHYSSVTIASGQASGEYVAAAVRGSESSSANTWYEVISFGALPNTSTILYETDGSSFNQLATSSATTWHAGDVMKLQATNSNPVTLVVFQNGSPVLTNTDSTFKLTGTLAGLGIFQNGGAPAVSQWDGGNLP